MKWRKKGAAFVSGVSTEDGRKGNVVLVGPRSNPKGAAVLLPGADGATETIPLQLAATLIGPQCVTDIVCMQERCFGDSGLPAPAPDVEQ